MRMIAFIIATFAASLLLADVRPVRAETGAWTAVYSKPANFFTDVAMFDDKIGLAVSAGGILRTTDGGRTWQEPQAVEAMMYGHVGIADADHAWVVALSGRIWHTSDSGLTWQEQASGTFLHLGAVATISPTEAWVTGRGSGFNDIVSASDNASILLHTVDGGATWTHTDGLLGYNLFGEIRFVGRHGWLSASRCDPDPTQFICGFGKHASLVTADGGTTWSIAAREPEFVPERMVWFDALNGVAIGPVAIGDGSVVRLYRTSDGGTSWQAAAGSVTGSVEDLQASSESSVWMALHSCTDSGCHTWLAHSVDGGQTWNQMSIPFEPVGLTGVFALAGDDVVVAAGPTGLARLDLATQTWSSVTTDAATPFDAVAFGSRDRGYAVGNHYFGVSNDGGATWTQRQTPLPLGGLVEANGDRVTAIVYDCGAPCPANVYRSLDGGLTWAAEQVDWAELPPLVAQERVLGADRWRIAPNGDGSSRVERSRDGGATWSTELTVPGYGRDLQLKDGRLWLHASVGVFGAGDRTMIYRRDVAATALSAPSVGDGSPPGRPPMVPLVALTLAGVLAATLGAFLRRRTG